MDAASLAALRDDLGLTQSAGIYEMNALAVRAFLWVATQWRTSVEPAGYGVRTYWIGLDYQGVAVALRAAGMELDGELLWRLQVMENAAAAAMNARSAG